MNLLLALASGHLLVALFPRFNVALLAPVALTPLIIAIARERSWWRRLLLGEAAGFVFWIGVCYWIRDVLAAYGGLSPGLSWLALILFALAKGAHMAVFCWLGGYVVDRAWAIPALAALWVGIERTHGPLGFAWLTLGNAGQLMALPLRLAPYVGVYGLSFIFAAMSAAVALLAMRRPRWHLAPLLLLPALLLLPDLPPEAPGTERAAVLQPNLTEDQPVDIETLANLSTINALNQPAAIIWPEVPVGMYWDRDSRFRSAMETMARRAGVPSIVGAVTFTPDGRPLNSALLIGEDGRELGRYSKTFLVPFGEFVPPAFGWIGKISTEAGDFASGDGPTLLTQGANRFGVFICYEAAFPHLVRQFTAAGANVLINISNDGWFFDTAAREQHLRLARMRAVENGRWIVRVTNNGVTAAIDPAGRVARTLPEFRRAAGPLPFSRLSATTPYTRFGDWFAWTCLAAGLAAALASASRGG
jgi:apolipoprotein N-acyltransferase